jgi:hypothetical protein
MYEFGGFIVDEFDSETVQSHVEEAAFVIAVSISFLDGTPPLPSYVRHIIPNVVLWRADGSMSKPLMRTVGDPRKPILTAMF